MLNLCIGFLHLHLQTKKLAFYALLSVNCKMDALSIVHIQITPICNHLNCFEIAKLLMCNSLNCETTNMLMYHLLALSDAF